MAFVMFCFVFRLSAFVEAAALRSIVLRYAGVPIATRVSFFLDGEYVVRYFLPDGVFSTLSPRAGFLTSAQVRIQSINQIG